MSARFLNTLTGEVRPLLRLATPMVFAELGWMTMVIVDTMFVGRVSAAALGGVSVGGVLFHAVALFGVGTLFGLDTLVSQAYGAKDVTACRRWLAQGLWLSLIATPVLMGAVYLVKPALGALGVRQAVLAEAVPYLAALNWSVLPLLIHAALRRYLQSMDLVGVVTFSLISANLVNAALNWLLVFGNWGLPAMGAVGAGWATTLSRTYMACVLAGYILWRRLAPLDWRLDWARIRRLASLGLPAASQVSFEVGLFAVAAALIGRLATEQLAAHQIALNVVSYSYMVPLGLGSAAAVRVGQAIGRRDPAGAGRAGWSAITLGAAFMACSGAVMLFGRHWIGRLFTPDESVIAAAGSLLIAGAAFQLCDGLQVVATGALRGLGDTRTPMLAHLCGYWFIGLPVGYWLCFRAGWDALGMWVGFSIALIVIGATLAAMWGRRVRRLGT